MHKKRYTSLKISRIIKICRKIVSSSLIIFLQCYVIERRRLRMRNGRERKKEIRNARTALKYN